MRFACLCCGHLTLHQKPPGSYEVCPVCYWEDDPAQGLDPELSGGANTVNLRSARANYRQVGAVEQRFRESVRSPRPDELPLPMSDGQRGSMR